MEQRWIRPRPAGRPAARPARWLAAAVLAGALCWYAGATAQYEAFDLGYSAGNVRATVERWSVRLPFGYRLAWWKSNPPARNDGPRLLRTTAEN
ncbi:MAG TPA: hypothetical protein VNT75_22770 [Symbiobacteriaceae bacterium]|nr:hypothetical protein [Symbiobacteriaceae bacterium]